MLAMELQLVAVIGTLRQVKEEQSTQKAVQRDATLAVQRTLEQRVEISFPIINRQLLSIQPVARKHFILTASVVAALKAEK